MLGKRSEQDSVKEAYDMRGSKPVQALWFVCGCSQQPDGKVPLLKEIIETPPNPQRFHLWENDPRYFWRFWRNIWPARTWTVSRVNWMPSRLPGICMLSSLQHYFFVTALSLSLSQHLSTLFAAEVRTSSQDARAARCLEPFGRRKSEQHGKIGQESLLTFHGKFRECWDLRMLRMLHVAICCLPTQPVLFSKCWSQGPGWPLWRPAEDKWEEGLMTFLSLFWESHWKSLGFVPGLSKKCHGKSPWDAMGHLEFAGKVPWAKVRLIEDNRKIRKIIEK